MHAVTSQGSSLEGSKGNGGKDTYMSEVVKERGAQEDTHRKRSLGVERKVGLPSQLYNLGIQVPVHL